MNSNEAIIVNRMAECLEHGEAIRGRFAILHSETQQELLARVPNLLQLTTREERLNAAIELQNIAEMETA